MKKSLKCTCPGFDDEGIFIRDGECPIHIINPESIVTHTTNNYLLVCLCDCDCIRCSNIPLKKLIKEGFAITIFIKDNKGNNRFLKLIEEEGDTYVSNKSGIQGSTK